MNSFHPSLQCIDDHLMQTLRAETAAGLGLGHLQCHHPAPSSAVQCSAVQCSAGEETCSDVLICTQHSAAQFPGHETG